MKTQNQIYQQWIKNIGLAFLVLVLLNLVGLPGQVALAQEGDQTTVSETPTTLPTIEPTEVPLPAETPTLEVTATLLPAETVTPLPAVGLEPTATPGPTGQPTETVAPEVPSIEGVVPEDELLNPADIAAEPETIDIRVLALIASHYGSDDLTVDLNGDGKVDILDLALVSSHYNEPIENLSLQDNHADVVAAAADPTLPAKIAQAVEAVRKTIDDLKKINDSLKVYRGRSVIVEVDNITPLQLHYAQSHHKHGGFAQLPNFFVAPTASSVFTSRSKGFLTGTEGYTTYSNAANTLSLKVYWDNPYFGRNKCSATLSGPEAYHYRVYAICGSGNTGAQMRYILWDTFNQ